MREPWKTVASVGVRSNGKWLGEWCLAWDGPLPRERESIHIEDEADENLACMLFVGWICYVPSLREIQIHLSPDQDDKDAELALEADDVLLTALDRAGWRTRLTPPSP